MSVRQFSFVIAIILFLSGCTHSYYAPNTANVPVFKEKNEVHVSAAVTNSGGVGGDFQAAYAVTNCIGVLANANVNSYNVGKTSPRVNGGNGFLFETGAGYYKPLNVNTARANNLFVFEVYGVIGFGRSRNYYWDSSGILYPNAEGNTGPQQFTYPNNAVTFNYLKTYIQPSISFSHNIIDIIFASKIGLVHTFGANSTIPQSYLNTAPGNPNNYNISPYAGTLYGDWQTLSANRTPFIFEPSFTIRLGFKWVKLQWQMAFLPQVNTFERNVTSFFCTSGGISVDIANRFKRKNTQVLRAE